MPLASLRFVAVKIWLWLLVALLVVQNSATAQPLPDLDLASTSRTQPSGLPANATVSITVGTTARRIGSSDLVTAAEQVALQQVLATGTQSLSLNATGQATGGVLNLTQTALSNLTVPSGVSVLHDFGTQPTINVGGSINNAGRLFAFSTNASQSTGLIAAAQIINQRGGLISTVLPANLLRAGGNLDLTLSAVHEIINAGSIIAASNLTLAAPNISNSGVIASDSGDLSFSAPSLATLTINNIGGRIEALSGAINVRDATFSNKMDLTIGGGNLLSNELNLFGGDGVISVDVEQLTGIVNLRAGLAHVQANTDNLVFGSVQITGDPTFINTGNMVLPAATAGQPYIAVAGGDITVAPGFILDTSSGTTNGGSITLIAGADASLVGGDVIITGRSATGGDVDLTGIAGINSSTSMSANVGGDITMVAFSQTSGSSQGGHVIVPAGVTIQTGTITAGGAGNLLIVAEAAATAGTPNSISIGNFDGISAAAVSSNVDIRTISPNVSVANPLVINAAGGNVTSGSFVPGTLQSGGVSTGNLTAPGGFVNIVGGGDTTTGTIAALTLSLTSGTGDFGSAATPIATSAMQLSANTNGDVFLNSTAPTVNLGQSSAADFSLQAAGKINVVADVVATGRLTMAAQTGINAVESVAATIGVGIGPTGSAVSADGSRVFIANTLSNNVSVIDTANNTVLVTIPVGNAPAGIAVSPDGARVYVANAGSDTISEINPVTGTVVKTITVPGTPTGVTFSSDGSLAFVSSASNDTVTIIDTITGTVSGAPLSVQSNPVALAYNRSNGLLYVGNRGSNSISVIHPLNRTVDNFSVSFSPVAFGACPCGTKLFVADGVSGVHAFSTETNSVVVNIALPAGSAPSGVGINPTGSLAYIANAGNGTVSTINTLTNVVSSTTSVAGVPLAFGQFASFLGDNASAYVSNAATNSVSFIRTPTLSANQYDLSSAGGALNVSITDGTVLANNPTGSVIVTSAKPIVSAGGSARAFQLATPHAMTINGPITASILMDLHAMDGVFRNNSTVTANGALFFIASPTIVNSGTITIDHSSGPATLAIQAPSGDLDITLLDGSRLTSLAPGDVSSLLFNPAGGKTIKIDARAGSIISADQIHFGGNLRDYNIGVFADQIAGTINAARMPRTAFFQAIQGSLTFGTVDMTQTTGGGVQFTATAPRGDVTIATVTADNSMVLPNVTIIQLHAQGKITVTGGISADGNSGGNITMLANSVDIGPGALISADATTGNGGRIEFQGDLPITVLNDGTIRATNTADSSGLIAFNSTPLNAVNVNGTGTMLAGNAVTFGRMNPLTLMPVMPIAIAPTNNFSLGDVSMQQGGVVGNRILVGQNSLPAPPATDLVSQMVPSIETTFSLLSNSLALVSAPANALIATDKTPISLGVISQADTGGPPLGGSGIETLRVSSSHTSPINNASTQILPGRKGAVALLQGRMLVTADEDLIVETQLGSVSIKSGAVVLLNLWSNNLAVYDLMDKGFADVTIKIGNSVTALSPGTVTYLTKNKSATIKELNTENFPLRNIVKAEDNDSLTAYSADFSLPSAIARIDVLRSAVKSNASAERKLFDQLCKNAAVLHTLHQNRGAFKNP